VELASHDYGGHGPDLLLLHGGGDNLETWRAFAPLLRSRFRVAAYDARGHGQSATPSDASVRDMVEDVAAVARAIGLDRPLLVGHSMGAVNALLAAAERDRFAGVVAMDGVPRWWSRRPLTLDELEAIGHARGIGWTGPEEELERQTGAIADGSPNAELIRCVFQRNHEPAGEGLLRRKPLPEYALDLVRIYQGPESGLTQERIEEVACPALLLCSEEWVTAPEAREFLADLPHRRPHIAVGWLPTGHYLHWEQPRQVADWIVTFWESRCAS
jgi:pimeloyl-ACP methyl ester carboxylesterase